MNWLYAITSTIVSYTLFSYFGMRTGVAASFKQALFLPFTSIIDFSLVLVGSAGFGVATYFALKSSPYAVPVIISVGLIVSFIFSVLFTNASITPVKFLALSLIIIGIIFLR